MDRKFLLENLERSIRTYDGFDGRFEVFPGTGDRRKRPFKWTYNEEAGFPLIFLHPSSEGPISDNDVLGQLTWPFIDYFNEMNPPKEALPIAELLYAQNVKPHIDNVRKELKTLRDFQQKADIKQTGKLDRMIIDMGNVQAQLKKRMIPFFEKDIEKFIKGSEALGKTGALQRLRFNLYKVLRACTNLTRENAVSHVAKLLSHCGIEEDDGGSDKATDRVWKSVIGKRAEKTRKEMFEANLKLSEHRINSGMRAALNRHRKAKMEDKS